MWQPSSRTVGDQLEVQERIESYSEFGAMVDGLNGDDEDSKDELPGV